MLQARRAQGQGKTGDRASPPFVVELEDDLAFKSQRLAHVIPAQSAVASLLADRPDDLYAHRHAVYDAWPSHIVRPPRLQVDLHGVASVPACDADADDRRETLEPSADSWTRDEKGCRVSPAYNVRSAFAANKRLTRRLSTRRALA
jgi:hypothetical protein